VRVIDSSGWLEWFTDGPLAGQYQRFLEKPREILLPAIVVYEVYKILKRERGEEMALLALGQMQQSEVVALDATLALHAADLSLRHGLAMADAIVYATARIHDCELVTSDADLKGLNGVVFLSKV
jgi:predicted nucleic acid-binding protein